MSSRRSARTTLTSSIVAASLVWSTAAAAQSDPIPAHNRAELTDAPRPPADDRLQALGAALFAAVLHDDPALAEAVFFPRPAFLLVKAIRDPGRYWDQLHTRFARDIHTLHRALAVAEDLQYDHVELAIRGGFVHAGEEGNRLPYWASRHSVLHYREHGRPRHFELRVMITWDDRWYLIHLSEFHAPPTK
jgi:hypothetical protein